MQVFKSFFKVFNKRKGSVIMYIGIFTGILFALILPNQNTDTNAEYVESKVKFSVFDYDNSAESAELIKYMSSVHELVEIQDDSKETIQDELFIRNINCVLKIQEGFADALGTNTFDASLIEVVTIPGTNKAKLFESCLNSYLNYTGIYLNTGVIGVEAMKKAETVLGQKADVDMAEQGNENVHSKMYYFFIYMGWVFVVMVIEGVTPILMAFGRKELKDRIYCSSYRFSNFNKEMLLSVFVTGAGICMFFAVLSIAAFGKTALTKGGALWIFNMCCFMAVSLALAFLVSKFVKNPLVLSMVGNIISLGCAFLSGIFVPIQFLGEKVVAVAHFLPTYWYGQAVMKIDKMQQYSMNEIFSCMGVQLLFAAAFIIVGIVAAQIQRGAAVEK